LSAAASALSGVRSAKPSSAGAAPQRERLAEPRGRRRDIAARARIAPGGDERLELVAIDRVAVQHQPVAGCRRLDHRAVESRLAQRPAQPRDVGLHRLPRTRRRIIRPQRVDERIAADRLPRPQHKDRQHDAHRRTPAERHLTCRTPRLQRTQHGELGHGRPYLGANRLCQSDASFLQAPSATVRHHRRRRNAAQAPLGARVPHHKEGL
jgi:hypothetical protein